MAGGERSKTTMVDVVVEKKEAMSAAKSKSMCYSSFGLGL
jgi:hypothetical protein